jgi:NAD(P)-dependent dehydrogenase (short-subunit alcohol dehydrogenase family)
VARQRPPALARAVRAIAPRLDGAFFNAGFGRFQPVAPVSAEQTDAQFGADFQA